MLKLLRAVVYRPHTLFKMKQSVSVSLTHGIPVRQPGIRVTNNYQNEQISQNN